MIREELLRIGQTELADTLVRVDPPTRRRLEAQLETLDLDRVGRLVADLVTPDPGHEELADLEPADVVPLGADDPAAIVRQPGPEASISLWYCRNLIGHFLG